MVLPLWHPCHFQSRWTSLGILKNAQKVHDQIHRSAHNSPRETIVSHLLTLMCTTKFTHTNTQPGYPGTHL